jgi:phosphoglycerol transferase MdoB-like AlkP superfamily enzyme
MSYGLMKWGLILSLTIALVFTFSTGLAILNLVVTISVLLLLCFTMSSHRNELLNIYLAREAKNLSPSPRDKLVWGIRPKLINLVPGIIIIGLVFVFAGYSEVVNPSTPRRFLIRLIYDNFGSIGIAATMCFLGIVGIVSGVEVFVGHHLAKRHT